MAKRAKLLLAVVFAFAFSWQIREELLMRKRVAAARQWPTVSGTLIDVWTETLMRRMSYEKQTRVRYTYVVNGRTYEGTRQAFAPAKIRPDYAQMLRDHVPVTVYYNPEDPGECTLEFGTPFPLWETIAGGIGAVVIVAAIVVWAFKPLKGNRDG